MELRKILATLAVGGAIIGGGVAIAPAATAVTPSCPDGWDQTRVCASDTYTPIPPRQR